MNPPSGGVAHKKMEKRGILKTYPGCVVRAFILETLGFGIVQVYITYSLKFHFNFFTEVWEKPKIFLPIVIAVTLLFALIMYEPDYD